MVEKNSSKKNRKNKCQIGMIIVKKLWCFRDIDPSKTFNLFKNTKNIKFVPDYLKDSSYLRQSLPLYSISHANQSSSSPPPFNYYHYKKRKKKKEKKEKHKPSCSKPTPFVFPSLRWESFFDWGFDHHSHYQKQEGKNIKE